MHVLSIPTWVIHVSSVLEWTAAIWLIWRYAEATGNGAWRYLAWGMLPALVSAMCACTWHFFDNLAALDWLVTLQAAMTVLGNGTMMGGAWMIWRSSPARTGQALAAPAASAPRDSASPSSQPSPADQ